MSDDFDDRNGGYWVLQSVRCLDCGAVYAKPRGRGTVIANPGCPDCGYVGWMSVATPVNGRAAHGHSGADQPLRRVAR